MAQEVVRSCLYDFYVLCMRLRERFQHYGRMNTLATELRKVLNVDVTDDTIRRVFFNGLPDTTKISFLQIKSPTPFTTGPLHGVCVEIIRRLETLMATLTPSSESGNFVKHRLARTMCSKDRVFTAARKVTRRVNASGAFSTKPKVSFRMRKPVTRTLWLLL